MKRQTSRGQRPLFHEGPVWQQLDEPLQQQLIEQLADICYFIVASAQASTNQQEESDDQRD
jgi:hypothetical protein